MRCRASRPSRRASTPATDLAPLAQTNVESLKEFAFFTFAKANGKKQKFGEPVDYYLDHKNGVLMLHFICR